MYPSTVVLALVIAALNANVAALPTHSMAARNDRGSAFTGAGGQAPGGSVSKPPNPDCTEGGSLLRLRDLGCLGNIIAMGSGNGGAGGLATSGASQGGVKGGHGTSAKVSSGPAGDAYSGVGGGAPGGSVSSDGLIDLFSVADSTGATDNGGNGGEGTSGPSRAGLA
ncbi:hypothetical protein BV22DRAFT_1049243 [Leucogyrophana mollusca]|uniref:Uncharacterized protein n=1 Tax=Leucogyrophana mollusca TaxID=85980 RepID=A0ACB8B896_9AGAM|nr:hypothetical protein BV22DRAFT_1049243 [Leucogyrophana mollusca]